MKIKKLVLLASMALAAAAFAVPASASASAFLHSGNPIAEGGETETYTGSFGIEINGGGFRCEQTTAGLTFEAESGDVGTFVLEGCETTGTLAEAGCQLEGTVEARALPWGIEIEAAEELRIANMQVRIPLAPGCGLPGMGAGGYLTWGGNFAAVLDSPPSLDELTLEGQISISFGTAHVVGHLSAAGAGGYEVEA